MTLTPRRWRWYLPRSPVRSTREDANAMATRTIRPLRTLLVFLAVVAAPAPGGADLTTANVSGLTVKWDVPIGAVTAAPIIVSGTAYVSSWSGNVYALDPATGAQRWVFNAGGFISGSVLPTEDGKLYFGNSSADIYCIRAD